MQEIKHHGSMCIWLGEGLYSEHAAAVQYGCVDASGLDGGFEYGWQARVSTAEDVYICQPGQWQLCVSRLGLLAMYGPA